MSIPYKDLPKKNLEELLHNIIKSTPKSIGEKLNNSKKIRLINLELARRVKQIIYS